MKTIDENIKWLENFGIYYTSEVNKFWHVDSETYFDYPKEQCDNIESVIRCLIEYEKKLAYSRGESMAKSRIRTALGI